MAKKTSTLPKVGDCFESLSYKQFHRVIKVEPHNPDRPQPSDNWITFEQLVVIGGSKVEYRFERMHQSTPAFTDFMKPLKPELFEQARQDAVQYILYGINPGRQTTTQKETKSF
jgi:hypothetical protein